MAMLFLLAPQIVAAQATFNGFATVSPGVLNIGSYSYNCGHVTPGGGFVNPCDFSSVNHAAVGLGFGADFSGPRGAGVEFALDGIHATQPATLGIASASFRYAFATRGQLHPFLQAGYGRSFGGGASHGLLVLGGGAERWFAPNFGWRIGFRAFRQLHAAQNLAAGILPVPGRGYFLFTLALLFR